MMTLDGYLHGRFYPDILIKIVHFCTQCFLLISPGDLDDIIFVKVCSSLNRKGLCNIRPKPIHRQKTVIKEGEASLKKKSKKKANKKTLKSSR